MLYPAMQGGTVTVCIKPQLTTEGIGADQHLYGPPSSACPCCFSMPLPIHARALTQHMVLQLYYQLAYLLAVDGFWVQAARECAQHAGG